MHRFVSYVWHEGRKREQALERCIPFMGKQKSSESGQPGDSKSACLTSITVSNLHCQFSRMRPIMFSKPVSLPKVELGTGMASLGWARKRMLIGYLSMILRVWQNRGPDNPTCQLLSIADVNMEWERQERERIWWKTDCVGQMLCVCVTKLHVKELRDRFVCVCVKQLCVTMSCCLFWTFQISNGLWPP